MTKDIVIAAIGAVLGTILGFAASKFSPASVLSWVVVLALLMASIAMLALLGPPGKMVRSAGKTKLAGTWRQEWTYLKNGKPVKVEDELEVSQLGRLPTRPPIPG